MGDAIQASVERDAGGCVIQLWVRDPDLVGKQATVKAELRAKVTRSSPVDKHDTLAERTITLAAGQNRVVLGDIIGSAFAYAGSSLELHLTAHVVVDDGLIFDTKLELDLGPLCTLPPRAQVPREHGSVHSPRDRFNFFTNLRAIPPKARIMVLWMLALGLPLIVGNALLGARDELVPESQVWFYDHSGEDGSESPLMKALTGSGGVGMALWLAIRRKLQQYMKFKATLPPSALARGARLRASDLIEGQAGVALQQATVRVVAYNREHGQYTAQEKKGKSTRTVTRSFTENSRGVVLYERLLAHVPANASLAGYLDGEVEFTPLFDALYPPFMLDGTHGLSLRLEAQLLHPEFVDQDIELDPGAVDAAQFYRST